jgi:NDP-sugar pyrophosphorylase family protein
VLTLSTPKRRIKIDYGVVRLDDHSNGGLPAIGGWEEKPEVVSSVSMGIYALEPAAIEFIPDEGCFDFPDLVQALLAGRRARRRLSVRRALVRYRAPGRLRAGRRDVAEQWQRCRPYSVLRRRERRPLEQLRSRLTPGRGD